MFLQLLFTEMWQGLYLLVYVQNHSLKLIEPPIYSGLWVFVIKSNTKFKNSERVDKVLNKFRLYY